MPNVKYVQYWSLSNWRKMRFRCSLVAVLVNWNVVVISPCFAIFKNVAHILEPGVTRRLTSLQNMCNVRKYCKIFKKRFGAVSVIFSIYLCSVLFLYSRPLKTQLWVWTLIWCNIWYCQPKQHLHYKRQSFSKHFRKRKRNCNNLN